MTHRFFIPEPAASAPLHNLFFFKFDPEQLKPNVFGEPPFPNYFETAMQAASLEEADAVLLPNNFNALPEASLAYLNRYAEEGKKRGIPVYAFAFGDYSHELSFPEGIQVFLMSAYKSAMRGNEILVPTTARAFDQVDRPLRAKRAKPVISFCGYAGLKTYKQVAKYYLKNALWDLKALGDPILAARKVGIYWRKRAMRALTASPLVETNFIVRRSFSGAARTIELSPEAARQEFIDSIVNADFVLAPKGDGNYSNRFLETLSIGRIPVFIDTDAPLVLDGEIPYDEVIVRVPMHDVENIAKYVHAFYTAHTDETWAACQRKARELFLTYLAQDAFFARFFLKPS